MSPKAREKETGVCSKGLPRAVPLFHHYVHFFSCSMAPASMLSKLRVPSHSVLVALVQRRFWHDPHLTSCFKRRSWLKATWLVDMGLSPFFPEACVPSHAKRYFFDPMSWITQEASPEMRT